MSFKKIIYILFFILIATEVFSDQNTNVEIGIDEKLDNYLPDDIKITNTEGKEVNLREIIDKPTVLNLVYLRCPGICTPLMDGIAEVVDRSDLILGEDYQIVSVSFDPTETPLLAKRKKNNYVNLIKKQDAKKGWNFFVTDEENVHKLTEAVGFKYKKVGNEFLHAGTIIMISPNGKITRYLNGTSFLPLEFKLALIEASEGISGPTINKVLQYCFNYDPSSHRYVLNITRVSGVFIMSIALIVFLVLVLKPVFKRKTIKENK